MKKLLVIGAMLLLAGCAQELPGKKPETVAASSGKTVQEVKKEAPYVGFLVTIGYDKSEWYMTSEEPIYFGDGYVVINTPQGRITTNNVVTSYPFYSRDQFDNLKAKFGIK